jgi:hypothetical protein
MSMEVLQQTERNCCTQDIIVIHFKLKLKKECLNSSHQKYM